MFRFFPASLISPTYTDKNNPFSRWTKRHSQFGIFSHPCFNRTFSNCLSHNSPAKGWPYRFRSRGTTVSSILDHDLGHLCRGRHPDLGTFNDVGAWFILIWVQADIASAACPAHPGSLDVTSITFAAVICDADEDCSVFSAYDPESSFTMALRSTTRPSFFWNCSDVIFVMPVRHTFQSYSHRFVGIDNAKACLVLVSQCCGGFPHYSVSVFWKALLLASASPTFYERFSWCV